MADRWYPSSKTCSACGTARAKLSLSERAYRCDCGLVLDRDLNAAHNLAGLVEAVTGTASGAGTGRGTAPANGRGEERSMGSPRCSSTNRQDGSPAPPEHRHRTVTATRQRVAPKPLLIQSDR